jgi:hypothetical protein
MFVYRRVDKRSQKHGSATQLATGNDHLARHCEGGFSLKNERMSNGADVTIG